MMLAIYFERQISGGSGSSSRGSVVSSKRMSLEEGGPQSCGLLFSLKGPPHHNHNHSHMMMSDSSPSLGGNNDPLIHHHSLPPTMDPNRHALSCSICRDKYKNPKVLPCLHTFCESCLIDYLPQESLTLTCPQCRQQSILPPKGVPALQTNFCVDSLSMEPEPHPSEEDEEKKKGRPCFRPDCGKGAAFRCHDCDVDMCLDCSGCHNKYPSDTNKDSKKTHQISPLHNDHEQGPNKGASSSCLSSDASNANCTSNGKRDGEPERYLLCPSHSGQTLRFFCRDCDTAVCSSCTDIEHGRHTTIRVMDAVVEEKLRLQELLDDVKTKVTGLEGAVALVDKATHSLEERKAVATEEIRTAFQSLLEKVREREKTLLKELDVQFRMKEDLIQNSRTCLKAHLKAVEECSLLTEKALSHENETEILFVKKQVGERLEDYAKMEITGSVIDDSLEFEGLTVERVDLSSVGRVLSSLHKGWAVSGDVILESRCVPIGRRHFLRLHAPLSLPPDLGLEDIHVSASTKEVVFSLEQAREADNREFLIRFLVSRVGPFGLTVSVKNQHISGSPFQFHAYDGEDRSASSSPGPFIHPHAHYHHHSQSATQSPTGNGHGSLSRIPTRANGASLSPRSRMSTPTKRFYNYGGYNKTNSNGHIPASSPKPSVLNGHGHIHGHSHHGHSLASSRRSATLEDDLLLKIGQRGRGRGEFTNPQSVVATQNGRLVVTDSNNQCVQIFDNTGEVKLRFGVRGRTVGQLQRPVGVAILPSTGNIAVADYDNKWISIFDQTGKFMSRIGHGKLLGPKGITVGENGLIYVVDNKASSILVFQPNGKLVSKFGSRGCDEGQFAGPHFIAVNSKGNIIVTDFHNHCVKVFDHEGDYLYSFGSNGEGNGQFNAPTGVAIDKNDNILVADWGNSRIQIFDPQGSFLSFVSTSVEPLYGPQGLTVTPDGYVAIADSGNHCVKLYKYG